MNDLIRKMGLLVLVGGYEAEMRQWIEIKPLCKQGQALQSECSVNRCEKKPAPWLVWLRGLSTLPPTGRSRVGFPVRAQAWVVGQVPRRGRARVN